MRLVLRDGRPALDETDPDLRLTAEQRAVFRHDREIVLSAGAGTGKTHTLALRFVALLVHVAWTEARPERVLVLTFTERAAAEMAERCRARLAEVVAVADASPWPGLAANLRRMLATFEHATIGTFHAFCASIVRGPRTTILDPLLAGERRDEALAAALAALRARDEDAVWRLLDAFGSRDGILRAAGSAFGRARAPFRPLHLRVGAAPVPWTEARTSLVGLRTNLELLVKLTSLGGGGGAFVDRVRELLADPVPDEPLAVWAAWREALELLLTDAGDLRRLDHPSVLGAKASWPDPRRHQQARAAAAALEQRLADVPRLAVLARTCPTPADRVLDEILPVLLDLLDDAEARHAEALDRDHTLTFDVLQRRAVRAVLDDDRLRGELRERYRYLMVDEFQDTDAAQWSLVRALGRERPEVREDRIFVVGDPKQAIYGFRGGDVAMFRAAVDEIGEPLRLSLNFRSRPELIDWFDLVFPTVLPVPRAAFEVGYDPLVAGRTEAGGSIDWLETEDEPAEVAADAVADALDRGAHTVALLLRARTHQDRFEAALRARGIPYTVPAGVSFWSRPEVKDLGMALCAAIRPDPIATVAWLRGPLGALPDARVDDLGAEGIDALAHGLIPEGFEVVGGRFLLARRELLTLAPSAWLERRIDELVPAFAIAEPGGRALANARRLVERVRPLDAHGAELVARVVRRALDADEREAEAPADGVAGVILTTVHGAKGLEFDVVVLPGLDRRVPPPSSPVLVGRLDGRWEVAFPVDDPAAEVQRRARPGLYEAVRRQLRAEAEAEERRLFYVAATRARERLVLIGRTELPEPGASPTWHQLLELALPGRERAPLPPPATPRPPAPAPPLPPTPPIPRIRAVELSVSALAAFEACPAAWGHARTRPRAVEERAEVLAAARGRVLHEVLEDDDPEGVERRLEAAVPGLTADERASGVAAVRAALGVRDLPEVARILAAPGLSELAFRVVRGPVTLRGRIDRLVELAEGPVVVDWKSGRRGDVDLQVAAYAWAASRIVGRPVAVRVVWAAERAVDEVAADPGRVDGLLDAVGAADSAERRLELARERARPCVDCPFFGGVCPGG